MSDERAQEAVDFLQHAIEAEGDIRQQAIIDLRFRYGDQWPQYAIASRGLDRPQLTINEMDAYIRQVTNSQRQQRPRIKVHPVDSMADIQIAKTITGMCRHIEVNSDADNAYDTAFDFAATIGWGYWRIRTDYIDEKSFDQDIFIDSIDNPFSVYRDPNSRLPDGSDQERCLVTDMMPLELFEAEYPGAVSGGVMEKAGGFLRRAINTIASGFTERGAGDLQPDWVSKDAIRIGEYFYIDRERAKLVLLSDGSLHWDDELPPGSVLEAAHVTIRGDRDSFKRKVKYRKQTAFEILEETSLPGRWIPIVPVYWTNTNIDGKREIQGLVRMGMDPQRMVNFWQTAITESIALAPKAKWLMAEGQDEGHEIEFKNANISANPTLRYKPTDVEGNPAPPPQRIQPEPPPPGAIEASFQASQNLQKVMGIFDPAVRGQQTKSGKAINAERSQAENSNFHGFDNLKRSIKHTGRIILSYIPTIYDTKRVQRIIGEDDKPQMVTLNDAQAIGKVLNDVRVGTYDVVMDTGPGYETKRIEGVESMMQLMGTPIGEEVAKVGADLMVRNMDFYGADVLADRLAAANPLSQIDEQSEIPPQVQMQIKSLQQKLQQAGQMIQSLQMEQKFKMGIERYREDQETNREHMRSIVKAHDTERRADAEMRRESMEDATWRYDIDTKADTARDIEQMRAAVKLISEHLGVHLEVAKLMKPEPAGSQGQSVE